MTSRLQVQKAQMTHTKSLDMASRILSRFQSSIPRPTSDGNRAARLLQGTSSSGQSETRALATTREHVPLMPQGNTGKLSVLQQQLSAGRPCRRTETLTLIRFELPLHLVVGEDLPGLKPQFFLPLASRNATFCGPRAVGSVKL